MMLTRSEAVTAAYTTTSSGWGIWFVAAVAVLAVAGVAAYRTVLLAVTVWRRHHQDRHPLAPLRPLPIRSHHRTTR